VLNYWNMISTGLNRDKTVEMKERGNRRIRKR